MAKENVEKNQQLCDLLDKYQGDRDKVQTHFQIDNHSLRAWISRLCAKDEHGAYLKPQYAARLVKWMRRIKDKEHVEPEKVSA